MTFNSDQPREADGKFGEKTGAAPDIALSQFPVSLSSEVQGVAEKLRIESLDEAGVTLNDIYALRSAANRAEYRLTEYEAEAFLAEKHPEVRGLLISFDGYSGAPYVAGVEVDDADLDSGRNYGTVKSLGGKYQDINDWATEFSHSFERFENEEMFDEYGTILIDDNSAYGEFTDDDGELGTGESRVYRFAERERTV